MAPLQLIFIEVCPEESNSTETILVVFNQMRDECRGVSGVCCYGRYEMILKLHVLHCSMKLLLTVWSFLWHLCIVLFFFLNINEQMRMKDRRWWWSGDIYWCMLQINEDTLRVLLDEISLNVSYWFYSNHLAMMCTQVRNGVIEEK